MTQLYSKDALIICPNQKCGSHIATFSRDVEWGTRFEDALFNPICGIVQNGERPKCRKCNALWYASGKIHLESGWK